MGIFRAIGFAIALIVVYLMLNEVFQAFSSAAVTFFETAEILLESTKTTVSESMH